MSRTLTNRHKELTVVGQFDFRTDRGADCRNARSRTILICVPRFLALGFVHPVAERAEIASADDVDDLAVARWSAAAMRNHITKAAHKSWQGGWFGGRRSSAL
jgi:hypothetical protein